MLLPNDIKDLMADPARFELTTSAFGGAWACARKLLKYLSNFREWFALVSATCHFLKGILLNDLTIFGRSTSTPNFLTFVTLTAVPIIGSLSVAGRVTCFCAVSRAIIVVA